MNEVRSFPEFKANWPTSKQASLSGCQAISWSSKPGIDLEMQSVCFGNADYFLPSLKILWVPPFVKIIHAYCKKL